nr:exonuclease DPD1, chloroplastic/mitochondrial [Tanacetum cinerariifolium]
MRAAMCFSFSHFQLPRFQNHTLSGSWWKGVHKFSNSGDNSSKLQLLTPKIYGLQGGQHSRRWSRKSLSTNTGGKNTLSRKTNNISQQITDVTNLTHRSLHTTSRLEIGGSENVHIEQQITENKDVSKLVTFITFDIETTGFSRDKDRIIEIAMQDLSGGENSTFETLVNPLRPVLNTWVHNISHNEVTKPSVPRMEELIPILVQYIQSRQKLGGQVILVAHNGKTFDVPFLKEEFRRHSCELPSNWLYLDTVPLARKVLNSGVGLENMRLATLRKHYGIPEMGAAHRAMADVNVLALVLQGLTRDLKLTVPILLENHTFASSDINNNSKKKKA